MTEEATTPAGWVRVRSHMQGEVFAGAKGTPNQGLTVIVSTDTIDKREWKHLSISRRGRIPPYEELVRARRTFLGEDAPAYQVFPVKAEHVNFHPNCLHLWSPIGFDPFPDPHGERAMYVGDVSKLGKLGTIDEVFT